MSEYIYIYIYQLKGNIGLTRRLPIEMAQKHINQLKGKMMQQWSRQLKRKMAPTRQLPTERKN